MALAVIVFSAKAAVPANIEAAVRAVSMNLVNSLFVIVLLMIFRFRD